MLARDAIQVAPARLRYLNVTDEELGRSRKGVPQPKLCSTEIALHAVFCTEVLPTVAITSAESARGSEIVPDRIEVRNAKVCGRFHAAPAERQVEDDDFWLGWLSQPNRLVERSNAVDEFRVLVRIGLE